MSNQKKESEKDDADYYCIDFSVLDDADYSHDTPREKYFEKAITAGKEGFAPRSLRSLRPISIFFEIERCLFIMGWIQLNMLPMWTAIILGKVGVGLDVTKMLYILGVIVVLFVITKLWFWSKYDYRGKLPFRIIKESQNSSSDRRNHKYFGVKMVVPKSLREEAPKESRRIFITVPHGILPVGAGPALPTHILAKNEGLFRTAVAPILTTMPVLRRICELTGYFPAGKKGIMEVLEDGDSPHIFIDGVAGITVAKASETEEKIWFLQRKAICAIAMQAKADIVPGYNFGHTELWSPIPDPWGILSRLSLKIDACALPFYGRWGMPMGPPNRRSVVVCYGDPINPKDSNGDVNDLHRRVMEGFRQAFDTHKAAYGWENKKIIFV